MAATIHTSSDVNRRDACPTADYSRAAIPEPYRILGLRLRAFSLGHYLLLRRFGCLFIAGDGETGNRNDLLLGVLICSMRHAEFLEFIEQKDFVQQVARWGKKIRLFDYAEKATLFRAYLRDSLTEPEYIALQPTAEDGNGDWAQSLKITLMTRLGYAEGEALDMPLSKALADYYALAESEGILRRLTAEDLAMAEQNAKALAALEKWNAERGTQNSEQEAPCPA